MPSHGSKAGRYPRQGEWWRGKKSLHLTIRYSYNPVSLHNKNVFCNLKKKLHWAAKSLKMMQMWINHFYELLGLFHLRQFCNRTRYFPSVTWWGCSPAAPPAQLSCFLVPQCTTDGSAMQEGQFNCQTGLLWSMLGWYWSCTEWLQIFQRNKGSLLEITLMTKS